MDFKQLQALVGIADQGSFSEAAEALGTVQSNISGRIARLESELGGPLIDRASGALTPAGEIVLQRARRILGEMNSIYADVQSNVHEVQGEVAIGVIGTTGRWLIPRLLDAQRSAFPLLRLRIAEGTNSSLEPRLAAAQIDMAVLMQPVAHNDLSDVDLFEEDIMLVVPRSHPTATSTSVSLPELAAFELLLPLSQTPLRREIDEAAEAAGVHLQPLLEVDGLRTLASLAFDGHGPAVLPATALPRHLETGFVAIPIDGLAPRRVGLAQRRYGFPPSNVRAVRELLVHLVADALDLPRGVHPVRQSRP
jgi:DNA-binding transcriptional LysR family regulator